MLRRKKRLACFTAAALAAAIITSGTTMTFKAYGAELTQSAKAPVRLAGNDRYETAIAVSKYGWTQSDYVVLANGQQFPDALCAAPLAKAVGAPILLTSGNELEASVKDEIARLKAKHVYIIGAYGAVSKDVEAAVTATGADVKRLGGSNRYETSVMVADELQTITKTPVSSVALVSGEGFADALSIAPVAAEEEMPILLTQKDTLSEEISKFLSDNNASIKDTYIIGGQGSVSDAVAKGASLNSLRLSGADRYETNSRVLSWFKDKLKFDSVYVVEGDGPTGNEFADALSGAALAVKTGSPIILTYQTLSDNLGGFMKNIINSDTQIVAVGGIGAVPQSIVNSVEAIAEANPSSTDTASGSTAGTGAAAGGGTTDAAVTQELQQVQSKLNTVGSQVTSSDEKAIVTQIQYSIGNVLANPNYNCSSDAASVKTAFNNLSTDEQTDLINKVQANMDENMLKSLASTFGL